MAKIKGSVLIHWVKAIRADKEGMLLELTDEDRNFVQSKVYPSTWYSYDTYRRLVTLVARTVAHDDETTLYNWGYASADEIVSAMYKHIIVAGSPSKTISSYASVNKTFFDVGTIAGEIIDDNTAHVIVSDFPRDFKPFYHIVHGWCAKLIALTGVKNIQSKYIQRSWAGDAQTVIEFTWS